MNPRKIRLLVAMALAVFTLGLAVAGLSQVRWFLVFGVILVAVLPGYGLCAVLLPKLAGLERLMVIGGLSLAVSILGGLLLNLIPSGLVSLNWAGWLAGVTVVSCLYALVAQKDEAAEPREETVVLPNRPAWEYGLSLAMILAILGLATASGVLSTFEHQTLFTQLWAVPSSSGQPVLEIGVRNDEDELSVYRITAESGGRKLKEWESIRLEAEGEWRIQMDLGSVPSEDVKVTLYRQGTIWEYRSVRISPSSFRTQ